MRIRRGKIGRRKEGEIVLPVVIFLVLTAIFLAMLFFFVYKSSTGAFIYEQIYAKKIALAIDSSFYGTEVHINIEKGLEISREERMIPIFKIDKEKGIVFVSLGGKAGYEQPFFSNYSISSKISSDEKTFILKIGGKND
jgi:hypothetical protein